MCRGYSHRQDGKIPALVRAYKDVNGLRIPQMPTDN